MRYVKAGLAFLLIALIAAVFILPNVGERYEPDPIKRRDKSLLEFEQDARKNPNSADLWCMWGNALVDYGREETDVAKKRAFFEQARQKAEKATQCDAKFTEAWMVWGHALYNLSEAETDPAKKREDLTEAIPKYAEAARLKPDYTNAWYNLGYMQKKLAAVESAPKKEGAMGDGQSSPLEERVDPKVVLMDCARLAAAQGNKEGCRAMLEQCKKELGGVDQKQLQADPAFDSVRAEDWFKAL